MEVIYYDNVYVVFSTSVTDVYIRTYMYSLSCCYIVYHNYVTIGVDTSSLKMVLLVKCGRWEIGGQKLWEVGDWG